ncbi:hypothetical protein D3C72_1282280 [compost metagenome]
MRGGRAEIEVHEAIIIDLVDQRFRGLCRPAAGHGMDDAEGIEEGVDGVDDQQEEGCRRKQRENDGPEASRTTRAVNGGCLQQ